VTKTVEIGLLTPPVGLNVFVVRNVAPEIPLADIFRGCVPFVIVEVLLVGALILWPGMTTVLMQGR
jgi:TRAP-type mannitol/chloroaromatic compound transport system permease large subunit